MFSLLREKRGPPIPSASLTGALQPEVPRGQSENGHGEETAKKGARRDSEEGSWTDPHQNKATLHGLAPMYTRLVGFDPDAHVNSSAPHVPLPSRLRACAPAPPGTRPSIQAPLPVARSDAGQFSFPACCGFPYLCSSMDGLARGQACIQALLLARPRRAGSELSHMQAGYPW